MFTFSAEADEQKQCSLGKIIGCKFTFFPVAFARAHRRSSVPKINNELAPKTPKIRFYGL